MDNLLRVRGRLKSTNLALNYHSQIIIGEGHPLVPLIVKHFSRNQLTLWVLVDSIKHETAILDTIMSKYYKQRPQAM